LPRVAATLADRLVTALGSVRITLEGDVVARRLALVICAAVTAALAAAGPLAGTALAVSNLGGTPAFVADWASTGQQENVYVSGHVSQYSPGYDKFLTVKVVRHSNKAVLASFAYPQQSDSTAGNTLDLSTAGALYVGSPIAAGLSVDVLLYSTAPGDMYTSDGLSATHIQANSGGDYTLSGSDIPQVGNMATATITAGGDGGVGVTGFSSSSGYGFVVISFVTAPSTAKLTASGNGGSDCWTALVPLDASGGRFFVPFRWRGMITGHGGCTFVLADFITGSASGMPAAALWISSGDPGGGMPYRLVWPAKGDSDGVVFSGGLVASATSGSSDDPVQAAAKMGAGGIDMVLTAGFDDVRVTQSLGTVASWFVPVGQAFKIDTTGTGSHLVYGGEFAVFWRTQPSQSCVGPACAQATVTGPLSGQSGKPFLSPVEEQTCTDPGGGTEYSFGPFSFSFPDVVGAVGYVACLITNLPAVLQNIWINLVNAFIDLIWPGPGFAVMLATFGQNLGERWPFSYVSSALGALGSAMADASGDALPSSITVLGTTVSIPWSWASTAASPYRPALVGLVYLTAVIAVVRVVIGSVGGRVGGSDE